jgi:F0F1-type ATP synthase assembly protein I
MAQGPLNPKEFGFYVALAQVGIEMVVPIALGFWLDQWIGSMPWATVVGAVVGFAGGLYHLISMVRQHDAGSKNPKQDSQ